MGRLHEEGARSGMRVAAAAVHLELPSRLHLWHDGRRDGGCRILLADEFDGPYLSTPGPNKMRTGSSLWNKLIFAGNSMSRREMHETLANYDYGEGILYI